MDTYWRMLDDQVRLTSHKDFPTHLEVYSPRAMEEYNAYGKFYAHWEQLNAPPPARPIPFETLSKEFKK